MLEHYPKELEARLVQSTKRVEIGAQRDPRISFLLFLVIRNVLLTPMLVVRQSSEEMGAREKIG